MSNSIPSQESNDNSVRSVDREVLLVMRGHESVGVGDLTEALGVTATAIRQRVERLLQHGLIEREKKVSGRGRPTYRYRLSRRGLRQTSADTTQLAEAMWQEIISIDDQRVRGQLIASVASRLGQQVADEMEINGSSSDKTEAIELRMQELSRSLSARKMKVALVAESGDLPILDIGTCPYPSLTDVSDDREMCRLEEKMISEALGQAVQLSSCRLDGDDCCQFSAVNKSAVNKSTQ